MRTDLALSLSSLSLIVALAACDSPGSGGLGGFPAPPDAVDTADAVGVDGVGQDTGGDPAGPGDTNEPFEPADTTLVDTALPDTWADTWPDTWSEDTAVSQDTQPPETWPADTSVPDTMPADTMVADTMPADTTVADTDTGPEVIADPCPTLPLTPLVSPQAQVFEMQTSGLGASAVPDVVYFEFFMSDEFGWYDLGSGANADYATCEQCVTVYQDRDLPVYFQARGSLTLLPLSEPMGQFIAGSIEGVELYEVTIDPTTFHATAVPNGRCIRLADGALSMF